MTSEREQAGVTVTAETLGIDGDGPDAIVVRVRGEEVGAYAIADDAEAERRAMGRMVDAILAQGRREGAEAMQERAAQVAHDQATHIRTLTHILEWSAEDAAEQIDEAADAIRALPSTAQVMCARCGAVDSGPVDAPCGRCALPTDTSEERTPPPVLRHDPDDERGCAACPLWAGVSRDAVCLGLGGQTLDFDGSGRGRFAAPPECPLRTAGEVVIRRAK